MAEIRWTSEAAGWLEDIFNYIADSDPQAAGKVVAGIYDKVQLLATYPVVGHMHSRRPEGEVRILLYGHYRIAYLLRQSREVVEILGVFHGALDIDRYL